MSAILQFKRRHIQIKYHPFTPIPSRLSTSFTYTHTLQIASQYSVWSFLCFHLLKRRYTYVYSIFPFFLPKKVAYCRHSFALCISPLKMYPENLPASVHRDLSHSFSQWNFLQNSIVYLCDNLLNHFPIYEYLGCFQNFCNSK